LKRDFHVGFDKYLKPGKRIVTDSKVQITYEFNMPAEMLDKYFEALDDEKIEGLQNNVARRYCELFDKDRMSEVYLTIKKNDDSYFVSVVIQTDSK
jgi:hypothetical protein